MAFEYDLSKSEVTGRCKKCRYVMEFKFGQNSSKGELGIACDYGMFNHHSRPCPAGDECTEFCEGKRRRTNPFGGQDANIPEESKETIKQCLEERKKYRSDSAEYKKLSAKISYYRHREFIKRGDDRKVNCDEIQIWKEERKKYRSNSAEYKRLSNKIDRQKRKLLKGGSEHD